jgi:beta-carotene 3-hydroxylase
MPAMRLAGIALFVAIAIVSFVAMELVTYAAHRWVMHGPLENLHNGHHRNAARSVPKRGLESNDVFPLAFSIFVMAGLWVGFNVAGMSWLVAVCAGVTMYGVAYTLVHDGVIHGRIPGMSRIPSRTAARLAAAHRTHHHTNAEPYGMLWPQWTLRRESQDVASLRTGSRPSQVPAER